MLMCRTMNVVYVCVVVYSSHALNVSIYLHKRQFFVLNCTL